MLFSQVKPGNSGEKCRKAFFFFVQRHCHAMYASVRGSLRTTFHYNFGRAMNERVFYHQRIGGVINFKKEITTKN